MNLKTHQAVLEKWKKRPLHATETFVSDGPIDPDRWLEIPRRVLFLAKEAYGYTGPGETWDLPKLVREEWKGPKFNFWWTLGYWAYGIQRLTNGGPIPSNPKASELWKEVTESVLASAIVNIKKSGGCPSSDDDDLRKYVHADRDLIERQVECLSPHVMVCCNTWHLVKDVWRHAEQISEQVHNIDGMLMLDFWHPAARYPDVMTYYTVEVLLHRALYLC